LGAGCVGAAALENRVSIKGGLMKIRKRQIEGNRLEMAVTVTPHELSEPLKVAMIQLAMQLGINPMSADDLSEAIKGKAENAFVSTFIENQVMNALAPFVVTREDLDIVMTPKVYSLDSPLAEGEDFSFRVVVNLKPVCTLTSYEPVSVSVPSVRMTEQEIDEQINEMADSYALYENEDGSSAVDGSSAADGHSASNHRKKVPAITDEWIRANLKDIGSLAEFRELLRQEGELRKQKAVDDMMTFMAVSELAKRLEGEIPDEVYEYTRDDMIRNLETGLYQQSTTLKDYLERQGMSEQQFGMEMMMQAHEVIAQGLALDALARHLQMEVSEQDILDTLELMAPGHARDAREQFENTGKMYTVRENARRNKTNQWLAQNAHITYEDQ
jgi:FKBP-type peptidyl-prolyl cis-trans isomerase (trigger factor)